MNAGCGMRNIAHDFINNEDGATSIEYALIVSLIAMTLIASLTSIRTSFIDVSTKVVSGLKG